MKLIIAFIFGIYIGTELQVWWSFKGGCKNYFEWKKKWLDN